jgi:hypothetical protein
MGTKDCSAWLPGGICRNFFPTDGRCGTPRAFCLDERLTARLYPETGWATPEVRERLTRELDTPAV